MKRPLLLSVLLALAGVAMLLVSPTVIPALSKTNSGTVRPHRVLPVAPMIFDKDEISASLVQRGFDINPVLLNLEGKNRALVGLEAISSTRADVTIVAPTLHSPLEVILFLANRNRLTLIASFLGGRSLVPSSLAAI